MRRSSRNNAICFESLEKALAEDPKTYGHLDLVCGGWPCRDNSIAGTRKGHVGARSGLWREFYRVIELFRPRWIIGENVPGLFSVNAGQDFWLAISDLDSLGYCISWDVLDSQHFGLAQGRKRVFIVGSLGNTNSAKVLFEPESNRRDYATKLAGREKCLCLNARAGQRNDPQTETIVATTVRAGTESGKRTQGYIAHTITCSRGIPSNAKSGNIIAETNAGRKGKTSRVPGSLDTMRGIVIGNAVSVNVAQWIAERIVKIEASK